MSERVDEPPLDGPGRWLLLAVATLSISYFMGVSVLRASNGASVLTVFTTGTLTWGSYLAAHYVETGRFVDEGSDAREVSTPDSTLDRGGVALGTVMMIAAVPVGIYGMHLDRLAFTAGATLLFLLGYYLTHYANSRTIL